jgi:hypothetical protein
MVKLTGRMMAVFIDELHRCGIPYFTEAVLGC